jgi:small-conductance mechanosensitive channel
MSIIDQLIIWLDQTLGMSPDIQRKILLSLVIVLVLWILHMLFQRSLVARIQDQRLRYQWQKTVSYIVFVLGLILIGPVWFDGLQSLVTYLGLLSAGLAVALKDPIANVMGWAFILWRKPFEIGDRIQIGDYAGDVIDLRVFQFTLMEIGNWVKAEQSTGRILHLPNGMIFTTVMANYTKGSDYIWNEIPVLVTFESDWQKTKTLLQDIAREHAQTLMQNAEESFRKAATQYMLQYGTLTSTVYTSVKDSGVLLTIRYLCEPRDRRDSTQAIWEQILLVFSQHPDIDFAYPTQRFYTLENTNQMPSQNIERM